MLVVGEAVDARTHEKLHAALALLHNFAALNGEAVRKILKKHDKTVAPDIGGRGAARAASRAYLDALAGCAFARAAPVIEGMRADVSTLFAASFARGDASDDVDDG